MIYVEEIDPEAVQPWKSGTFGVVDSDLGGVVAYAGTEELAGTIRDAILVSETVAELIEESGGVTTDAKCGCYLNDEGRGHWSACPEAPQPDDKTEPES